MFASLLHPRPWPSTLLRHPPVPATDPASAWRLAPLRLIPAHRRAWARLCQATTSQVLCQVPLPWLLEQFDRPTSPEMALLPPVDFVIGSVGRRPGLAVLLVPPLAGRPRAPARGRGQDRLLIGLLQQLPLRTLVWSERALPDLPLLQELLGTSGPSLTPSTPADLPVRLGRWLRARLGGHAGPATPPEAPMPPGRDTEWLATEPLSSSTRSGPRAAGTPR